MRRDDQPFDSNSIQNNRRCPVVFLTPLRGARTFLNEYFISRGKYKPNSFVDFIGELIDDSAFSNLIGFL
jgi:hypothetical protein